MKTATISKSNTKGCYFFKVRPRPDIPMKVEVEEDSLRNPNAMTSKCLALMVFAKRYTKK